MVRKALVFPVTIIAVAVMVTVYGFYDWWQSRKLATEGRSTTAKVLHNDDRKPDRQNPEFYLTVGFESESKQAQVHTISVSRDVYYDAVTSGTVTVHYLPSKPSVLQAGPKVQAHYIYTVRGFLILAFAIGIFFVYKRLTPSAPKSINVLCEPADECSKADKQQDADFFDYGRRELEKAGFVFREDTEDPTFANGLFFRTLVAPDGATLAVLSHVKMPFLDRLFGNKDSKMIEFRTSFSNGHYVMTTDSEPANKETYPDVVHAMWLPSGAALQAVLRSHIKQLAAFRERFPEAQPVPMESTAEGVREKAA